MDLDRMPEPPLTDEDLKGKVPKRKSLRDAVEGAFDKMGGEDGLIDWIQESTANKRIFYRDMLPKLIPKEVANTHSAPDGGPVRFVWGGGPPDPAKETEKDPFNNPAAEVARSLQTDDDE